MKIWKTDVWRAGVTDLLFLFSFLTLTSLPKVVSAQIISIPLCISHECSQRLNANQVRFKRPTLTPRLRPDIRKLAPSSAQLLSAPPDWVSGSRSAPCVGSTPCADTSRKVSSFASLCRHEPVGGATLHQSTLKHVLRDSDQ